MMILAIIGCAQKLLGIVHQFQSMLKPETYRGSDIDLVFAQIIRHGQEKGEGRSIRGWCGKSKREGGVSPMKVMLVQPPSGTPFMDKIYMYEPLALEYLGAGLKEDKHEVLLLDVRLDPDFETAFRRFQPDAVGLTGYTNHLNIVKDMAIRFKEINPAVYIVVGGHHATVSPKDYNIEAIDVVVIGEGVFTLKEVLKYWTAGLDLESIPGLAIPGREMKFTEERPHPPLDALPFPDMNP